MNISNVSRWFTAALLTFGLLMTANAQSADPVAKVNGTAIPQSRMDAMLKTATAQGQPESPELRNRVRDELITREILLQEAAKKGIEKTPDVVNQIEIQRQSLIIQAFLNDYVRSNPISDEALRKEYENAKSAAGAKEYKARHILVATDFSEPADAAVAYGRALAANFSATLHVLHVTDDVYLRLGGDAYLAVLPELQKEIEDEARKRLESQLVDNDPRPLKTEAIVTTSPNAAAAIVEYAAAHGMDLIVVGTHGRGGVGHLLLGSIAERVVRTAKCPVLTVRHPEHEFVTTDAPATA